MNALQLHHEGFGYGPAGDARIESERALRRALPASFLLVTGLLLALAAGQRLLPRPPGVAEPGASHEHWVVPIGLVPPPSAGPAFHPGRVAPDPGRVLPVADDEARPAEPDAGAIAHPGTPAGDAGGRTGDEPEGTARPAADPEPGTYVYADQLPERVVFVAPEYPDMAREAGVEGTVQLWALVDLDGSVKAVQVIRSVPLLDAAAGAAVKRWRFTPALANGHPVRVWVAVPVRFSLH